MRAGGGGVGAHAQPKQQWDSPLEPPDTGRGSGRPRGGRGGRAGEGRPPKGRAAGRMGQPPPPATGGHAPRRQRPRVRGGRAGGAPRRRQRRHRPQTAAARGVWPVAGVPRRSPPQCCPPRRRGSAPPMAACGGLDRLARSLRVVDGGGQGAAAAGTLRVAGNGGGEGGHPTRHGRGAAGEGDGGWRRSNRRGETPTPRAPRKWLSRTHWWGARARG